MAFTALPDAEYLCKRLAYNPATGELLWNPHGTERWTKKHAGKPALAYVCKRYGYKKGQLDGIGYRAHRIIWKMVTGEDPSDQIDHINGDRSDNRWENLRVVSASENRQNTKMPVRNTSGIMGVSWHRKNKRWRATVGNKHLGFFASKDAAAEARRIAINSMGFHPNHGRR